MAFYQQAIELDPDFALAHAGVANTFALRASMYGAGDEWAEKSIQQRHCKNNGNIDYKCMTGLLP